MAGENEIANAWMHDERAFEELFRSHYESLCRSANLLLNDADEAEEMVQNVFVTLWEKRSRLEITTSVKSYLYRSIRNASLNRIKHEKVKREYTTEQELLSAPAAPASHQLLQKELQVQISLVIASLPEQCRLIFKMSRFEEMKYAEIADELGISVKTVENQMGKALKILRTKLKDYLILIIFLIQSQLLN